MIVDYQIPSNVNLLVKKGDRVNFETPLFENNVYEEIKIDVVKNLEINPKTIFRYLVKLVGEKVEKDEIIASKKGIFSSKKIASPFDGTITEIDHNLGTVTINTLSSDKKNIILSPFFGTVEKVEKNLLKIKLNKGEEFELKKSSDDFGGEIFYLNQSEYYQISNETLENKIIVSTDEKLPSFIQIKAEALGAKGFITLQSLSEKTDCQFAVLKNIADLKKIVEKNFKYCTVIKKSDKIYFYL